MLSNQEMLEKIEYLRENADIGYEEALTLLERFDGDMTRVLIELERSNRIRRAKPSFSPHERGDFDRAREEYRAHYAAAKRRHGDKLGKVMNVLVHKHILVSRKDELIVNLPVACYVAALIFAPHLTLAFLALMFITGCRIHGQNRPCRNSKSSVHEFVSHAAQNAKVTFDSVTNTIKNDFRAKNNGDDVVDEGDEGGEFTVE